MRSAECGVQNAELGVPLSFLRINQYPVMDHDRQIILPMAGQISHDRFAGFGQITPAAAKSAFFKNLPPIGGYQFVMRVEDHQVEVIFGGLEKDQILALVVV